MALQLLRDTVGFKYNPTTVNFRYEDWVADSGWVFQDLVFGTATITQTGAGGVLVLSGAATTDNSGGQVQMDVDWVTTAAGKDIAFGCWLKASNVVNQAIFAGLSITDTTVVDGAATITGLTASDCIGLFKPDGADTWHIAVKGATTVVLNEALPITLVADTYYWLEFVARMTSTTAGTVSVYLNGSRVGDYVIAAGPTVDMTPTVAQVSGTPLGTISSSCRAVYAAVEY